MKIFIQLMILSSLFFSCNKNNKHSIDLSKKSIYSNFKTGVDEWYLTNPKDSVKLYMFEWALVKTQ